MVNRRLSFFISSMGDGGAQRVISILCKELIQREYDVEILSFLDLKPKYCLPDSVKVKYVPKLNIISKIIWLRNYFRNNDSTIISFLAPFNMISILATRGLKRKIIVADRNDPNKIPASSIIRAIRNCLYKYADKVVVQTRTNQEYFENHSHIKPIVIYNPVDMGEMVGKALDCKKDNLIVSVGRLEKQKNQESLIRVFSKIHERYADYKLVIYGEGSSREELEKLIASMGLNNAVSLPGSVPDVNKRMLNAQIFVLSSKFEGMPNALIEAMCLGLPVVSTKVSGATDVIENNVNGLLVEVDDDKQLSDAIEALINNIQLRNQLGTTAKELANDLSVETITDEWVKVIG